MPTPVKLPPDSPIFATLKQIFNFPIIRPQQQEYVMLEYFVPSYYSFMHKPSPVVFVEPSFESIDKKYFKTIKDAKKSSGNLGEALQISATVAEAFKSGIFFSDIAVLTGYQFQNEILTKSIHHYIYYDLYLKIISGVGEGSRLRHQPLIPDETWDRAVDEIKEIEEEVASFYEMMLGVTDGGKIVQEEGDVLDIKSIEPDLLRFKYLPSKFGFTYNVTKGRVGSLKENTQFPSPKLSYKGIPYHVLANYCIEKLLIANVDGIQGGERDLVFFSTVRSGDSIGFLSNPNRINVALTRAKKSLVVFGNKEALSRKTKDFGEGSWSMKETAISSWVQLYSKLGCVKKFSDFVNFELTFEHFVRLQAQFPIKTAHKGWKIKPKIKKLKKTFQKRPPIYDRRVKFLQ